MFGDEMTDSGREFHTVGQAREKARSPCVMVFDGGTDSLKQLELRRVRFGM